MAQNTSQIPLSFPVRESHSRENFMPAPCNLEALAWIDRWPEWNYPALIIYGAKGCGKTHLSALWTKRAEGKNIVIDDADRYLGREDTETGLFHQFNAAKESGDFLLLTMERPPATYTYFLPDLKSRLCAAPSVEVQQPDDIALQGVFLKLCHDRQLKISPEVIQYILPRIERNYDSIRDLVSKIDTQSLSEKRAITVPFIRDFLD
jgi:chromosomal replication initiation ATPase DnaA